MSQNPTNLNSTEETTTEAHTDSVAAPLLDDVPVQVSLELGRVTLTARELLSLRTGHVVEIDRAPGDLLELSANGSVIAAGELVEIEGRLGIRIERLVGA